MSSENEDKRAEHRHILSFRGSVTHYNWEAKHLNLFASMAPEHRVSQAHSQMPQTNKIRFTKPLSHRMSIVVKLRISS
ncbi:MAG: hypothetical protein F4Y85_16345 [Gammaproteobacteria bacterium]|nr:hypothetical protein [Gammaproteobacteria bacterium]